MLFLKSGPEFLRGKREGWKEGKMAQGDTILLLIRQSMVFLQCFCRSRVWHLVHIGSLLCSKLSQQPPLERKRGGLKTGVMGCVRGEEGYMTPYSQLIVVH